MYKYISSTQSCIIDRFKSALAKRVKYLEDETKTSTFSPRLAACIAAETAAEITLASAERELAAANTALAEAKPTSKYKARLSSRDCFTHCSGFRPPLLLAFSQVQCAQFWWVLYSFLCASIALDTKIDVIIFQNARQSRLKNKCLPSRQRGGSAGWTDGKGGRGREDKRKDKVGRGKGREDKRRDKVARGNRRTNVTPLGKRRRLKHVVATPQYFNNNKTVYSFVCIFNFSTQKHWKIQYQYSKSAKRAGGGKTRGRVPRGSTRLGGRAFCVKNDFN